MKNLDAVYAEKIAAEYTVKPASKLVALKKLDRRARRALASRMRGSVPSVKTMVLGLFFRVAIS